MRASNQNLFLLFVLCLYPSIGHTQEALSQSVPAPLIFKEAQATKFESVVSQICKDQIKAYQLYKTNFKKGKNLPETLAALKETRDECEIFVKEIMKENLLPSFYDGKFKYPLFLENLNDFLREKISYVSASEQKEIEQLLSQHRERVIQMREDNPVFVRLMLSLRLCSDLREQKQLLFQRAQWKKSIKNLPLLYSLTSSQFLSLQDEIKANTKNLAATRYAIKQNRLSPLSCTHSEIKQILKCSVVTNTLEGYERDCGPEPIFFLGFIATEE